MKKIAQEEIDLNRKKIAEFFDKHWDRADSQFDYPEPDTDYFVVDATDHNVDHARYISCAVARYDKKKDHWYTDWHNPITYYDFRDEANNCGSGEKVTHFISPSRMASFLREMMEREGIK